MTPEEISYYKNKLINKKQEILSNLQKHLLNKKVDKEEGQEDLADKAFQTYQQEYLYYLSDSDRFILQLIDEALERITKGTYGYCIACFGKIQQKRLEAVPWARHCIHCQELQDQGLL